MSCINPVILITLALLLTACGELRVTTPLVVTTDDGDQSSSTDDGKADRNTAPTGMSNDDSVAVDDSELEAMFNVYSVNYLEGLPTGEAQRSSLCARGFQDRFSRWYCGEGEPTAETLDDLLVAMDLKELGAETPRHFAVSGHSSSLVMRRTSSVNPRVVYFSGIQVERRSDYIAMGYVRGDFLVEVAAFDTERDQLNFYLVKAEKSCEPDCTNGDRFLPSAEIGWEGMSVYPAEDLRNTAVDCLSCHQPGGPETPRMLRMQELVFPWTHWFATDTGSRVLLDQFLLAHDEGERYGTIPVERMRDSAPAALEFFVRSAGFGEQPNMYDGQQINRDEPQMEERSPIWDELYFRAVEGQAISPPHYGIDPFDKDKLMNAVTSYKDVLNHGAEPSELVDMNDVFRDDLMDELGFEAAEGVDASGIVQHRCGFCHSGDDPNLSRDNFRVQDFPDRLSPTMKQKVIDRINLGKSSRLRMPPTLFSDLAPEQIDAIENALE